LQPCGGLLRTPTLRPGAGRNHPCVALADTGLTRRILSMGQSPSPLPSLGSIGKSEESRPPLVPMIIGVAAVVIAIVVAIALTRGGPSNPAPSTVDPYAASLPVSDVAMSTADNFAGQQVTYIEGKITNNGNKTVNGATMQILFHDSLGQVTQKDSQRVMVITTRQPYVDTAPLSSAPLKPGQTKDFRLTFEHVSADWNMQVPELTITRVSTQ
jgi:hypothetical protein